MRKWIVFGTAVFSFYSVAAEMKGVTMPDAVDVGREKLVLNGLGLRSATIFGVKVYVAGLYLKTKSMDSATVLSSPDPKQVRMRFVRDVSQKDAHANWEKSFSANCETRCETSAAGLNQLKGWVGDLKKNDEMIYTFVPAGVEVTINGEKKGVIAGKDFSLTLLSSWIGKNPPNEDLKKGMLGALDAK